MQEVNGLGLGVSDLIVLVMIVVGLVVSASEIMLHYKDPKALKAGLIMAGSTLFFPATMAIYTNYIPKGNYTAHTITKELKTKNISFSKNYAFEVL